MKRNTHIPWNEIISRLSDRTTPEKEKRLDIWLQTTSHKRIFQELAELWHRLQGEASYEPDLLRGWSKVRRHTIGVGPGNLCCRNSVVLRRVMSIAIAVCLFVGGYFIACFSFGPEELSMQEYTSLHGKSEVLFSDGTKVYVREHATLSTDRNADSRERTVILSGEALFDVAKDEKRPFVVEMDELRIVVHGTRFNVRRAENSRTVFVSLFEGSVSLLRNGCRYVLNPGEMAICDTMGHVSVSRADIELERCWAQDQLTFEGLDLREVCRYLSRWYDVEIEVDPQIASEYVYNFTLREEPLEEILRIMSRINPVEYRYLSDGRIYIAKRLMW